MGYGRPAPLDVRFLSLIATVESPDLRIIPKTLPWKQQGSKGGPGVRTECLHAALFPIWPNNRAPVRQHRHI